MAVEVERLIVRLEASQAKFEKQLARANQTADKRSRSIEARFAKMNRNLTAGFGKAGAALAGVFAAAASLRGFQALLDASTRIENSLKTTGLAGQELSDVYDQLFESAQRNAAPIEALTELYSRAALVQNELGVSTEELLGFTDRVALALRVSGKSAQESSGALLQLSQALGSGVVRAEEFNSILEGALPIAQAAAAGLEEAGGSVAKLRQLVVDGAVSSEAFFRAFEAGSVILEQKVAGAEQTLSQRFVRLRNVLIDTAGRLNDATGATDELGKIFDSVSRVIPQLGDALISLSGPVGEFLGLVDQIEAGLFRIAKRIGEITGLNQVGAKMRENLNAISDDQIQSRIDGAFSSATTPKTDRLQSVPEVKTVSLRDYAAPAKKGGGGKRGGGRSRQNDLQREIQQIRERTDALRTMTEAQAGINPLIEDYGLAMEKAAATAELETAAKRAGIEITPQLRAQIEELAGAYALASAESEKLAESQDKAKQQADDLRDLGKDVLGGFINDLRNGVDAAEALENALQKVADKLLDMALNNLFAGLFGGGGGGLLSLFGFANGGIAARGRPQPLPRFAGGGVARSASIFGEAGPEAAVPLPDGRRIPVDLRVPSMAKAQTTSISMPITIDARDANAPALARVTEQLRDMQRTLPRQIDQRISTRDVRKTRP